MISLLSLSSHSPVLVGNYKAGDVLLCTVDSTDGIFTVTLPDATNMRDTILILKKINVSSNAITITTVNGQTIDGLATKSLSTQYARYVLMSDGKNYHIVN